jgi:hypothetical protein
MWACWVVSTAIEEYVINFLLYFKTRNTNLIITDDKLGHGMGDRLLREFPRALILAQNFIKRQLLLAPCRRHHLLLLNLSLDGKWDTTAFQRYVRSLTSFFIECVVTADMVVAAGI